QDGTGIQRVVDIELRFNTLARDPEAPREPQVKLLDSVLVIRLGSKQRHRDGAVRPRRQIATERRRNLGVGEYIAGVIRDAGKVLVRESDTELVRQGDQARHLELRRSLTTGRPHS